MKTQYMSDLHMELWDQLATPGSCATSSATYLTMSISKTDLDQIK